MKKYEKRGDSIMIYTVTLNAALDKVISVNKLVKNHNNKVKKLIYDIGGKATHVSVVLSSMDITNIATGILAGENGKKVQNLLEAKNVKCDYVWQQGNETRESFIIVPEDEEGSYMITQRGFGIKDDTFNRVKDKLSNLVKKDDIVVFAGGPPPKITVEKYRELLNTVKDNGGRLVVDVSGEYLKEAIEAKVDLIKPNKAEFNEMVNKSLADEEEYIKELKRINEIGVEVIALSLGREGSIISTKDKTLRVYPPKIREVNDTGCGDVFLGGAVAMMAQEKELEEVFRFATAISASKATKEGSSDFDIDQALGFLKDVRIQYI
ncbi:1-phosphofructokinase family hexose kinase [Sporosalibacterium faouarense]|uniref:1-phosphofructokinase family hexose kinase n=1 Tax=Sporosalibacterium faouarense TaxID=516123 RepID=UPI001A9C4BFA|nr:1-phosphofructokinase family hexose kinase [Sporosalibacterium faouarense]